jgi:hypothetical protein
MNPRLAYLGAIRGVILALGGMAMLLGQMVWADNGKPVDASALPLLAPGTHIGIIYSDPSPEAKAALDARWNECLAAGLSASEPSISWSDLASEEGMKHVEWMLSTCHAAHLSPYLSITTINTNQLTLPESLADPADPTRLAGGRHFDDPEVIAQFGALLDRVVPLLVKNGGFFLSVGNEIDGYLGGHRDEATAFVHFVEAARRRAHAIDPRLAVGATFGAGAMTDTPELVPRILAVSDAAAFTYYPLNPDFSVCDPSVVAAGFDALLAASGDLPVLLQEVGYPSGYMPAAHNGSSPELQRQFVANVFAALRDRPRIRFVSFLQLADWTQPEVDAFVHYYSLGATLDARFPEYLATLGLCQSDGSPKPAYEAFLDGLRRLASGTRPAPAGTG